MQAVVTMQIVASVLWIALFVRIGWALLKPAAAGMPAQIGARRV